MITKKICQPTIIIIPQRACKKEGADRLARRDQRSQPGEQLRCVEIVTQLIPYQNTKFCESSIISSRVEVV